MASVMNKVVTTVALAAASLTVVNRAAAQQANPSPDAQTQTSVATLPGVVAAAQANALNINNATPQVESKPIAKPPVRKAAKPIAPPKAEDKTTTLPPAKPSVVVVKAGPAGTQEQAVSATAGVVINNYPVAPAPAATLPAEPAGPAPVVRPNVTGVTRPVKEEPCDTHREAHWIGATESTHCVHSTETTVSKHVEMQSNGTVTGADIFNGDDETINLAQTGLEVTNVSADTETVHGKHEIVLQSGGVLDTVGTFFGAAGTGLGNGASGVGAYKMGVAGEKGLLQTKIDSTSNTSLTSGPTTVSQTGASATGGSATGGSNTNSNTAQGGAGGAGGVATNTNSNTAQGGAGGQGGKGGQGGQGGEGGSSWAQGGAGGSSSSSAKGGNIVGSGNSSSTSKGGSVVGSGNSSSSSNAKGGSVNNSGNSSSNSSSKSDSNSSATNNTKVDQTNNQSTNVKDTNQQSQGQGQVTSDGHGGYTKGGQPCNQDGSPIGGGHGGPQGGGGQAKLVVPARPGKISAEGRYTLTLELAA